VTPDPEELAARTWRTIELRLATAHPALLERVPKGADPSLLSEVEAEIGVALPALVRAIYLLHDGIGMPAFVDRKSQPSFLLSLADAVAEWRLWHELLRKGMFDDTRVTVTDGAVRARWWSERWLPISADGAGNHYCLDMDPASGGQVGQVIGFWHDDGERNARARDLADYLVDEVDAVEWAMQEGLLPSPPPWRGGNDA
jgi:cell wall assembly regulator SMI1